MPSHLWNRARELFLRALELPEDERPSFVDQQDEDTEVRALVAEMLAAHKDDAFLEQPDHIPVGFQSRVLDPGEEIDGYRIVDVIGEGGMGIVYRAERDGQTVALKLIRPGAFGASITRRFEREADVLSRLDHPGIARILEASSADTGRGTQPYFAMQYIDGVSLLEYVHRNDLDLNARLELLAKICEAVAHAHRHGIVHRDLKPGNIRVDKSGAPSVLDFGIARVVDSATIQQTIHQTMATGVGQLLGSIAYMSPEQAHGDPATIDARSDVYSLGVLCYQVLVGRLPYSRLGTLPQAIHQITSGTLLPVTTIDPTIPDKVEVILGKALEKGKEERYADAGELGDDLRRFLRDEPIVARRPGVLVQLRRFAIRNRALSAALVLVLVSLSIATFVTARAAMRAGEQRTQLLRLADLHRLERCLEDAKTLWPEHPAKAAEMRHWLDNEAGPLREYVSVHQATLEKLRESGRREADGSWSFEDIETEWQHDQLVNLIDELEKFFATDADAPGTYADVRRRYEFATTVEARSVTGPKVKQLWQDACDAVRKHPRYRGLELAPQLGFVPLGPDPESGLWEFAHLRSGVVPERDADGKLRIDAESALVFVLIPPGSFDMGAQRDDPNGQNYDPEALAYEGPVRHVDVDAFFLSKYELSQATWTRGTGLPPLQQPQNREAAIVMISWLQIADLLKRWALSLPTETQWEYAARAGTQWIFWTGNDKRSLAGAVNMADSYFKETSGPTYRLYEEWLNDGYAGYAAPVDTMRANPFGLHHMLGNVWEFCRDDTDSVPATDWPQRAGEDAPVRGGSWDSTATNLRSSKRGRTAVYDRNPFTGARFSHELQ